MGSEVKPTVRQYLERWLEESERSGRHSRYVLAARAAQLRLYVLPLVP